MMAALSAAVMFLTCEVRVVHESNYANYVIPGCDDGQSSRNFGRICCSYFYHDYEPREERENNSRKRKM
jgi:hypothetical protein